MRNFDIPK